MGVQSRQYFIFKNLKSSSKFFLYRTKTRQQILNRVTFCAPHSALDHVLVIKVGVRCLFPSADGIGAPYWTFFQDLAHTASGRNLNSITWKCVSLFPRHVHRAESMVADIFTVDYSARLAVYSMKEI